MHDGNGASPLCAEQERNQRLGGGNLQGAEDDGAEPEHAGCKPEALAIMREYVASLPESERAFITARHLEATPQEELAARLGITRWTVRSLEARLRKELLARLEKAGIGDPFHG